MDSFIGFASKVRLPLRRQWR